MASVLPHSVQHPTSKRLALGRGSARDAGSRIGMREVRVIHPLYAVNLEVVRIARSVPSEAEET